VAELASMKPGAALPFRVLDATASPTFDARAFISGLSSTRNTWGDYPDRLLRYEVHEAIWEGSVYKTAHAWSRPLKLHSGLYDYTRSNRAPGKRVVDFWGSKTYPGVLDLDAGDGKTKPSACPIETDHEYLRPLISQIWKDSVWQVNKDIFARLGACHGDVFLQGVDDPRRGRVYFVVREARTVYDVAKDERGNVTGYTIVEHRPDPGWSAESVMACPPWVLYVEECWKEDAETIRYRTSIVRNGQAEPYDWREYEEGEAMVGPEWDQPYGFVPMTHIQNRDVGKGWGWSVYQGSVDKLLEVDDVASKVHDYLRKVVDNYWFVSGATAGEVTTVGGDEDCEGGSRDNQGLVFGPKDSKITAMIAPLNIADASKHLDSYDSVIIQDFPELMAEDVSPAASGESRRVAREKVEAEVVQHRAPYDAGLVMMDKMLLSIWIKKQYPGLPDGLSDDSFRLGELDHSIGDRPVFAVSEAHRLETAQARADVVSKLVNLGGMPLPEAMRAAGYPEPDVLRVEAAQARAMDDAEARLRAQQAATLAGDGEDGP
jgi:hypothetical protein